MTVKELWPGSKEPATASITGVDGQDITTFAVKVAILPKGVEPPNDLGDALWETPTAVRHPSPPVIEADLTIDETALPAAARVFNVWIVAHSGAAQIVPRIAAQLKRPRI